MKARVTTSNRQKDLGTRIPRTGPYADMLAALRRSPAVRRVSRDRVKGGHLVEFRRPASFRLMPWEHGGRSVSLLSMNSRLKNHGHGRHALATLLSIADRERMTVRLFAEPYGQGGLGADALVAFYESVGFEGDGQGFMIY